MNNVLEEMGDIEGIEGFSDFSFSDTSDDEDVELQHGIPRAKNENYLEETVANYDDTVFFEHFRIGRGIVHTIAERYSISEYYKRHHGQYGKLSALSQVLVFLWFIGHQTASFRDVSDRFDITISSLHRIIRRLTVFLSNLSPEIIKWPTENEKLVIEQAFNENGFPGIIGAIDGCHIQIDKPNTDPDSYINRKGYYSIQLQAVCDNARRIRDIFVGFPGSVHDSRVFRNSPLYNTLQQRCGHFYLLGDSGYPLQKNLQTPFKDRGQLTRRQNNYNVKLSKNRYVIEHSFGILKQKFRQLYHIKLRDITYIVHLIRAACVLHNISIDDEFILNENEIVEHGHEAVPQLDLEDEVMDDDQNARQIRDNIVNVLRM